MRFGIFKQCGGPNYFLKGKCWYSLLKFRKVANFLGNLGKLTRKDLKDFGEWDGIEDNTKYKMAAFRFGKETKNVAQDTPLTLLKEVLVDLIMLYHLSRKSDATVDFNFLYSFCVCLNYE